MIKNHKLTIREKKVMTSINGETSETQIKTLTGVTIDYAMRKKLEKMSAVYIENRDNVNYYTLTSKGRFLISK